MTDTDWDTKQEELTKQLVSLDLIDAVSAAQMHLRELVKKLISEDRCLDDSGEKEYFHQVLPYSLLGLESAPRVNKVSPYSTSDDEKYERFGFLLFDKSLGEYIRWLADLSVNPVRFYHNERNPRYNWGYKDEPEFFTVYYDIRMKELWEMLLQQLYILFPKAIQKALAMAHVGESKTGQRGFSVDA